MKNRDPRIEIRYICTNCDGQGHVYVGETYHEGLAICRDCDGVGFTEREYAYAGQHVQIIDVKEA